MKTLIAGSGGREHALLEALLQSEDVEELYVAPGSDRMGEDARRVDRSSVDELVEFMTEEGITLCIVGPESYLDDGIADRCREEGIHCWGPVERSARLETSKSTAKDFLNEFGIPTGRHQVAKDEPEVRECVRNWAGGYPVVLKYDGLAGGKGVRICRDDEDVETYIQEVYRDHRFGEPDRTVVEEYLEGPELSLICAVSDGSYQMFPPARDYKPRNDGGEGPNTGGMGVVAGWDVVSDDQLRTIEQEIVQPTINGLESRDLFYRGFLFFGLILTDQGPRILEYNCRFGDPEAQAILPLVEGNVHSYIQDAARGDLPSDQISFRDAWSVGITLAYEGYPYEYGDGIPITGLDDVRNVRVFHAGTEFDEEQGYLVSGGRILTVVGRGVSREEAVSRAYNGAEQISFEQMHYRTDIGKLHFEA